MIRGSRACGRGRSATRSYVIITLAILMVSMRRPNPLIGALTVAAIASGCGDASRSEMRPRLEMPPASDVFLSCSAEETMTLRPPSPSSLKAIAARADLVAEIEITGRYEMPGQRSVDEVTTRRMASAVVHKNLSGPRQDQQLVIYVSLVSRTAEGKAVSLLGTHPDEQLVTGTRLLAGLISGSAGEYELSGGDLLIGDDGQLSVLGFEACPTDEEKALSQEVSGRSKSDVVADLQVAIERSQSPNTGPQSPATRSNSTEGTIADS